MKVITKDELLKAIQDRIYVFEHGWDDEGYPIRDPMYIQKMKMAFGEFIEEQLNRIPYTEAKSIEEYDKMKESFRDQIHELHNEITKLKDARLEIRRRVSHDFCGYYLTFVIQDPLEYPVERLAEIIAEEFKKNGMDIGVPK